MKLLEEITLGMDEIIPYENNPRDNRDAIAPVVESIRRFGYVTPIIVDKDNVIVAGHTRWLALKQLGWEEAKVLVTTMDPEKCKEFRIIDNKTGEMATWDKDRLVAELRSFESDMTPFFEGNDLEKMMGPIEDMAAPTPDSDAIAKKEQELQTHFSNLARKMHEKVVRVRCRSCSNEFAFDVC